MSSALNFSGAMTTNDEESVELADGLDLCDLQPIKNKADTMYKLNLLKTCFLSAKVGLSLVKIGLSSIFYLILT